MTANARVFIPPVEWLPTTSPAIHVVHRHEQQCRCNTGLNGTVEYVKKPTNKVAGPNPDASRTNHLVSGADAIVEQIVLQGLNGELSMSQATLLALPSEHIENLILNSIDEILVNSPVEPVLGAAFIAKVVTSESFPPITASAAGSILPFSSPDTISETDSDSTITQSLRGSARIYKRAQRRANALARARARANSPEQVPQWAIPRSIRHGVDIQRTMAEIMSTSARTAMFAAMAMSPGFDKAKIVGAPVQMQNDEMEVAGPAYSTTAGYAVSLRGEGQGEEIAWEEIGHAVVQERIRGDMESIEERMSVVSMDPYVTFPDDHNRE